MMYDNRIIIWDICPIPSKNLLSLKSGGAGRWLQRKCSAPAGWALRGTGIRWLHGKHAKNEQNSLYWGCCFSSLFCHIWFWTAICCNRIKSRKPIQLYPDNINQYVAQDTSILRGKTSWLGWPNRRRRTEGRCTGCLGTIHQIYGRYPLVNRPGTMENDQWPISLGKT